MFHLGSEPWNKNRAVGARTAFTQAEIRRLVAHFRKTGNLREWALMTVAIDTMFRVSDLRKLKVEDVVDSFGVVHGFISCKQKKTKQAVIGTLTKQTERVLGEWILASNKKPSDYLFTAERGAASDKNKPLSDSSYRRFIKRWVQDVLKLDPTGYSCHSLRRTKAVFLYEQGITIEQISVLLGHKDVRATIHYLGIDQRQAEATAIEYDIFAPVRRKRINSQLVHLSDKQLEKLAELVYAKLQQRFGEA